MAEYVEGFLYRLLAVELVRVPACVLERLLAAAVVVAVVAVAVVAVLIGRLASPDFEGVYVAFVAVAERVPVAETAVVAAAEVA